MAHCLRICDFKELEMQEFGFFFFLSQGENSELLNRK